MKYPVTVLLAVYNGDAYLEQAIESILFQTFSDFEFIIVNNGSTDRTPNILRKFSQKDKRVRIIEREKGLIGALNQGLQESQGELIARMDADDISSADRLYLQVEFMKQHPDVGVCGGWIRQFGNGIRKTIKHPINDASIRSEFLFSDPISNPTAIIRRDILEKYGIIYHGPFPIEDYAFWVELSAFTHFANIPKILLDYRLHPSQGSRLLHSSIINALKDIFRSQLIKLGIFPDDNDLDLHYKIFDCKFINDLTFIKNAEAWLLKLHTLNQQTRIYPFLEFKQAIGNQWWHLAYLSDSKLLKYILSSPLVDWANLSTVDKSIILARVITRPIRSSLGMVNNQ